MFVKKIDGNHKMDYIELLFLADEQMDMIEKYLYRGEMFALYEEDDLKSVCVVTRESDDVCELKNIATYEKWHSHGYGGELLQYLFSYYKGKYKTMLVGTGDSLRILDFYERNGFEISYRVKNFFIDNYDHPMFEEGVQLIDMVYLSKKL